MMQHMHDHADDAGDDSGATRPVERIGGEDVEYYPAPAQLVAHDAFERAWAYDFDAVFDAAAADALAPGARDADSTDQDNVAVRCVVSARLRLGRFRTIEFLELSKSTDPVAALYPEVAWVKIRGVYGIYLIVMLALWVCAFVAGLVLALHASSVWHIGVVGFSVVVFAWLSRRVMSGHVVKESSWYRLPYSTWCDLVKCMTLWDNEGVSHSDIYTRSRVFFDDVACDDEHDTKVK